MEEVELNDDYVIGVGESSDGELIFIQGILDEEIMHEILTTRENAIQIALIILEMTGYDEDEDDETEE
jgi:hypothetical protein